MLSTAIIWLESHLHLQLTTGVTYRTKERTCVQIGDPFPPTPSPPPLTTMGLPYAAISQCQARAQSPGSPGTSRGGSLSSDGLAPSARPNELASWDCEATELTRTNSHSLCTAKLSCDAPGTSRRLDGVPAQVTKFTAGDPGYFVTDAVVGCCVIARLKHSHLWRLLFWARAPGLRQLPLGWRWHSRGDGTGADKVW